ncbi:MAG TPA: MarR family transcriptional regulator [Pararhizobium sp.]|uniref:MarR family winged helix-turn-helix transcriptional regulator n=1 Tax=Pararhizobium sp. TaxID=1977563 RepID=UPI002C94CB04|nr:MarR family transcriptional regulator [Pararhizobium sp.]HTO32908.1 MarR family transcriptional regulator [Pararhizobium sp.]
MRATESDLQTLFRFFNEIGIVAQLSATAFEKVMPPGMTLPQFVVLNHLSRLGDGRTPLSIAQAVQVTKGAMTNTLGHLEGKGLITLAPDPHDGRSKRVFMTQDGQAARLAAIEALGPELSGVAGEIVLSDIADVLPVLENLRKVLDARRNPKI